jgi:hypothetical protein
MKARTSLKILIIGLIIVSLVGVNLVQAPPAKAAAPTITAAVAVPSTISLFGATDTGTPTQSPFGPGWTYLVVKVGDGSAGLADTVTVDLGSFVSSIMPSDMSPYYTSSTAWSSYISGLSAVPLSWDATNGIWKKKIRLFNDIFLGATIPGSIVSNVGVLDARAILRVGMRLGSKTITATATNTDGSTTANISLTVVDAQLPLKGGDWNLLSTTMPLSNNTWAQLKTGITGNYDAALKWNASTQTWSNMSDTDTITPLEAFYVKMTADDEIGAIFSRSTYIPSRSLSAGWNLVGASPDLLTNWSNSTTHASTSQVRRGYMKVDDAFVSIYSATSSTGQSVPGYAQVVSPSYNMYYTSTYSYGTFMAGTYPWSHQQKAWSFVRDETAAAWSASTTKHHIMPFGAYWVFMNNADTLAGFTYTPVDPAWLDQAIATALGL